MNKTTTKKHSVQHVKKEGEPVSFDELMQEENRLPNPQIIINILNYSKALKATKTESIGVVAQVVN